MINITHTRIYKILCLSLIFAFIYSACAPATTPEPSMVTEQVIKTVEVEKTMVVTEKVEVSGNPPLVYTDIQENGSSKVTIELPWQGRQLEINKNAFGEDLSTQLLLKDFILDFVLLRPIINIEVFDRINNFVEQKFDPPLVMTAEYTPDDWEARGIDPNQLFIAIYDSTSGKFNTYETTIDRSASTGTIQVNYLTSQAYWATPGLTKVFYQEDGLSIVKMELPWQGRPLDIVERAFKDDLDPSFPPAEYIREIKYIQVIDPIENKVVHEFNPPLAMAAQYTADDLKAVDDDPSKLLIGIYNHDSHNFEDYFPLIDKDNFTGKIFIQKWTSHACWRR